MEAKGVAVITLVVIIAAVAGAARAEGGPGLARRGSASAPTTHLHFYFHDKVSKPSPTAVRVVDPVNPSSQSFFGGMNVIDDPLTEGPEPGSKAMGRAQGMYMGSDQAKLGFLQAMNLVFTDGTYNGSVVTVLGRNCPLDDVREMPVIGGTGAFRFARGYAQARTHTLDLKTGDAIVEYNVYVMH